MGSSRGAELKVGILILASLGMITAFILVLSNFRFTEGFIVHVDFNSSTGLREGGLVRVSGIKAGRVSDIKYLDDESRGEEPFVRVTLELDPTLAATIRQESAKYMITTKGLLGEPYVEIQPGQGGGPRIKQGEILQGEFAVPPQLMMSKMSEVLNQSSKLLDSQEEGIAKLISTAAGLAEDSRALVATLKDETPAMIRDLKATMEQTRSLLQEVRDSNRTLQAVLGDGQAMEAMLQDGAATLKELRATSERLGKDLPGLLEKTDDLLGKGQAMMDSASRELTRATDSMDRVMGEATAALRDSRALMKDLQPVIQELSPTLAEARTLARKAGEVLPTLEKSIQDVPRLVNNMNLVGDALVQGKGTVGAMIMDRAMYDDMREMLLDLKRRPWKIIWKE